MGRLTHSSTPPRYPQTATSQKSVLGPVTTLPAEAGASPHPRAHLTRHSADAGPHPRLAAEHLELEIIHAASPSAVN